MKLQEQISRIQSMMGVISENTKSTNKEFNKYKDSKFNTLRDYTLQDIVDIWESLSDHKNENIKTIKYFVNNPNKITDLVYDEKGLEDGYHRLIAAKILKKPRFKYKLVENINKSMMGKIIHNSYDTDLLKESISINNPSTDDYNENDCGCYFESIDRVFSTKEKAEAHVKKIGYRKYHFTIHEEEVE